MRFPSRALIETQSSRPGYRALASRSLTSRHNRINLHSLPPLYYYYFFFFFSLNIELSHHLYSTKERERETWWPQVLLDYGKAAGGKT